MANLKYGSQGEDVKKLQQALIDNGYNVGKTGADGIVGKNTVAAIKEYQKDNGLTVDGIAGKNTLGALYGTTTTTTPKTTTTTTPKAATTTAKPKTATISTQATTTAKETDTATNPTTATTSTTAREDPLVQEAFAALQSVKDSTPGAYTSMWQDEMDSYLNQYKNRDPFSYDFNSDALYNQYKDQYILQGQMAMMDTMGQAAAMTGGYGNSYAQTVGQQAYNQQLNQLNDIMPELYGMAYDRYNQEGQNLLNMYNIYAGLDERDYNRNQNDWDNWYKQLDYATGNYNTLYNQVYGEQRDAIADSQWQQTFDYNAEQDAITNDQWQKTFDYNVSQDEITNAYNDKVFNYGVEQDKKADQKSEKNDNWNKLVDLLSTGNYDTAKLTDAQLKAAGMTRAEAEAIAKGVTTGGSGTGGNTSGETKYKDLDYESQEQWLKKIENATSAKDIQDICDRMEMEGFDPEDVAWFYNKYVTKFTQGGGSTQVDPTSYEGVKADILNMANADGSWDSLVATLDTSLKKGYITKAQRDDLFHEAAAIRQKYASSKYTK